MSPSYSQQQTTPQSGAIQAPAANAQNAVGGAAANAAAGAGNPGAANVQGAPAAQNGYTNSFQAGGINGTNPNQASPLPNGASQGAAPPVTGPTGNPQVDAIIAAQQAANAAAAANAAYNGPSISAYDPSRFGPYPTPVSPPLNGSAAQAQFILNVHRQHGPLMAFMIPGGIFDNAILLGGGYAQGRANRGNINLEPWPGPQGQTSGGFLYPPDHGYGGGFKNSGQNNQGGLNLFKWRAPQTTNPNGWFPGDRMLFLPNRGSSKLNWKQNYGQLRSEMRFGMPIFDSYIDSTGNPIKTDGFLNAERYILTSRGWWYDPRTGAYYPPNLEF